MKNLRFFLTYLLALFFCGVIRISPRFMLRFFAMMGACGVYLIPSSLKLCRANIQVAFPDWTPSRTAKIARRSIYNMILNFLEFIWMSGIPRRIEKVCYLPVEVYGKVQQCGSEGTRIIFVNPHLGSWETSGLSAPYYGKVALAAIAKPTSNKYLNKLISSRREQAGGLQVIFARGAMRAAVKALKSGMCLGTLIDQNTKVRDGGCLVDFFGLPVASSAAPAVLMRYCRSANIPAVIFYAVCVRENKRLRVYLQELAKPFDEYASDQEVIQELMRITEDCIRRYPDQYVWLYRRFRYIPREASEEQIKRFPYYAENVKPSFYDRRLRGKSNNSIEMKSL